MRITVPYIEGLEAMSPEEFDSVMEKKASAGCVDKVNWSEDFPYKPVCNFLIARSHDYIAIRWSVEGADLRATFLEDNGNSWEDSCCEFFCACGNEYVNVETTCIGSVLAKRGTDRDNRYILPSEEVATVIRRSSLPFERIEIEGGLHKWQLTTIIPFKLLGLDPDNLPSETGANFYKCGNHTAHTHFLSWNPISTPKPNFHCPEFFGTIVFE